MNKNKEETDICCATCELFNEMKNPMNIGGEVQGQCLANPPVPVVVPNGGGSIAVVGMFPVIEGRQRGCSRWEPGLEAGIVN